MASIPAETPIQEGDNVSWKWGNGEPTGTVAEVKTDGQLEIESKGKLVHKNADPSNPAVHVAREGNDVVKRASELTKLNSYTDESDEQEAGQPIDVAPATADEQAKESDAGASAPPEVATDAPAKPAPKKRAPRKKSNAAATAGDKRERTDEAGPTTGTEEEAVEKEAGKKTKKSKAKTAEGGEAENGDHDVTAKGAKKKGPGRPRKGSKSKEAKGDGHEHTEEEAMAVDTGGAVAEEAPVKKRGPGRPKKSDAADQPPPGAIAGKAEGDIVAARTRSKGE